MAESTAEPPIAGTTTYRASEIEEVVPRWQALGAHQGVATPMILSRRTIWMPTCAGTAITGLRYCRVLSPAQAVRDGLPGQPLPGGAVSVADHRFAVQWTIRRHPWSAGVGLSHSSRHLLWCGDCQSCAVAAAVDRSAGFEVAADSFPDDVADVAVLMFSEPPDALIGVI